MVAEKIEDMAAVLENTAGLNQETVHDQSPSRCADETTRKLNIAMPTPSRAASLCLRWNPNYRPPCCDTAIARIL
jgi:hypothetical protein